MSQFLFTSRPVSLPSPNAPFAFNTTDFENQAGEFCNKIRLPRMVDTTPYEVVDTNVQVDALLEVNDYLHVVSNGIVHNFTGTNSLSPRERQLIELGTQIVAVNVVGDFVDIILSKSVLALPTNNTFDQSVGFIFCAQKFFDVSRSKKKL